MKLEGRIRQLEQNMLKSQDEADFTLVDLSQTPAGQVLGFLSGQTLGPAGLALYDAIYFSRPLTDNQLALLGKVLDKLGHPEYMEPIQKGIIDLWAALGEVDKQCKTSALGMK